MGSSRLTDAVRRFYAGLSARAVATADDSGQDLLEYALLVSLVVIVCIGAVDTLGGIIKTVFWDVIANAKF